MATDRETQLLRAAYASAITSPAELANFMAQVGHESNGLNRLEEGFRYTKGSWQISANVSSALRAGREALEDARLEALRGQPQQLAELMYGGRMGNDQPGDGYRYRGRGYIQLTGKDQYREAGHALGLDLVNNPYLAADPAIATGIATWYWQRNVPQAARNEPRAAGAAINGRDPPNGLGDREARFTRWRGDITPELMELLAQGRLGQSVPGATQVHTTGAASAAASGPRNFDELMRVVLPPQDGVAPHMTSDYGPRTLNGRQDHHGGADFNYRGGQSGLNLRHPVVHSPVGGEVVFSGGRYGTVKIRDAQGNVHEILHLDSRSVQVTDPPTRVLAGDPIGTMGGRGPNGAEQYAQHVHYQIRTPGGRTVDPERFWDNRAIEAPRGPSTDTRTPRTEAMADGVLRQGERGAEIVAAQQALNRLGYTGRDGQPLETRSGLFGPETRHAVEDFQRRHGLKSDGVVGDDTRAPIAIAGQRPLLSEATHPNHRLYSALATQLPDGTPPQVVASVALQALENGIGSPDRLARVDVRGSDVFVMGTMPGDRVRVDLTAPAPGMQQSSDHARVQSQQGAPALMRMQDPVRADDSEVLRPRTMLA